jgi:hypothetical protein
MLKRMVVMAMALTFAVTMLIGCGGPPKEEMEKVKTSKANADKVNAAVYSKEAYDAAAALEKDASEMIKKSEFDKAKAKLIEAIKKYDEAGKAAPDNMKKMGEDAKAAIAAFKTEWEAYGKDKVAAAAVKKMKKDEAAKYTTLKTEIETAVKDAEGMCDADPNGATAKVEEIKAKFADLKAMTAPKAKTAVKK